MKSKITPVILTLLIVSLTLVACGKPAPDVTAAATNTVAATATSTATATATSTVSPTHTPQPSLTVEPPMAVLYEVPYDYRLVTEDSIVYDELGFKLIDDKGNDIVIPAGQIVLLLVDDVDIGEAVVSFAIVVGSDVVPMMGIVKTDVSTKAYPDIIAESTTSANATAIPLQATATSRPTQLTIISVTRETGADFDSQRIGSTNGAYVFLHIVFTGEGDVTVVDTSHEYEVIWPPFPAVENGKDVKVAIVQILASCDPNVTGTIVLRNDVGQVSKQYFVDAACP